MSEPWLALAACRNTDPTLFYAFTPEAHQQALQLCNQCPVTPECALERHNMETTKNTPVPGVWGGQRWTINENKLPRRRAHLAADNHYRGDQ